jgi:hypothetical protein
VVRYHIILQERLGILARVDYVNTGTWKNPADLLSKNVIHATRSHYECDYGLLVLRSGMTIKYMKSNKSRIAIFSERLETKTCNTY